MPSLSGTFHKSRARLSSCLLRKPERSRSTYWKALNMSVNLLFIEFLAISRAALLSFESRDTAARATGAEGASGSANEPFFCRIAAA